MARPGTLGELRSSGWVSRPVKEEVRKDVHEATAPDGATGTTPPASVSPSPAETH